MATPLSAALYEFSKDPVQKKSDKRYGAILAQQILSSVKSSATGYFSLRNKRFEQNELFATGKQPMAEYLDMLNIDGKAAFVNLDLTPPPFAPKFMEVLIGRFMEREERPTVSAVDKTSKDKKMRERDEAEWRMKMGEMIGAMESEIGMPLEDKDKYTPVDNDDLTLWEESELYLPEEIKFQKVIGDSLQDINYQVYKRGTLTDLAVKGMAVSYVYRDANGHKKYKRCHLENVIYSYSDKDDFHDCKLIGELDQMKISDAREYYPGIPETEWFEMHRTSTPNTELFWEDHYASSIIRPYDDCVVEVFKFAVITTEPKYWVKGKDRYGKPTIDQKDNRPAYPNGKVPEGKEVIQKEIQVVYEGCYSVTTNKMLSWKMMENMIKPHHALHEVFGPFCVIMPNNIKMSNVSMAERTIPSIRQLTLTHLKLQQLIGKMRPDGYIVDVAGLHEIDLGLGKTSSPLELQKVTDQTGYVYYSSKDEEGNHIEQPIRPTENNNAVSKIQTLIETYNFYLQRLRDDLGTNEYVEGQGVNPKLGLGIRDGQVAASNRATNFVYTAYVNLLEQVAKRFAVMEWYDIMEGKRKSEYGMNPEDFTTFVPDIHISMMPTDDEQQYILEMAQTALTAGIITFEEAFKVKRLAKKDVKLAEIYLAKYEKKRKAQAMAENQANIQATSQAQQASNQQTHENQAQLEQLKNSGKIDVVKETGNIEKNRFVQSLILEYAKLGVPVPDIYAPLVMQYLQNVGGAQQIEGVGQQMQMAAIQQNIAQQQEVA